MAKDIIYPDCKNCRFSRWMEYGEATCGKHNFIMPKIDWNMACNDWQQGNQALNMAQTEPGKLYYYSYSTGEIILSEFAPFTDLQNPILSVSIRLDHELGWAIYPRRQLDYFPAPNSVVTVHLQDQSHAFQVVNEERKVAAEMVPIGEGQWDTQYHTQFVFMLCNPQTPNLLYHWLGTRMDIEHYKTQHSAPSLFAFIEVVEDQRQYVLHFDELAYSKYSR